MLILFLMCALVLLLLVVLTLVSYLISEFSFTSREELSSYECGFEHHSLSRLPISIRYFMLTVVFLIFDMEIILLSFYPIFYLSVGFSFYFQSIFIIFVVILFLGLLFEWNDGSLDWVM